MSSSENWISVARLADVPAGTAVAVETMGLQLALCHVEGGSVHAIDNVCTHAFALLTDGWFEGCLIECPLHAGQFDVTNGHGQGAPIDEDVRAYRTKVVDGEIFVELPA